MATLTPAQIYQVCLQAGFSPDQAVTWTAVAMAESGGRPDAHNPNAETGDNSYGLWQVNMLGNLGPARREQYGIASNEELFDPLTNARAAYAISGHGTNLQPWSVTHDRNQGTSRDYRQYLDEAQAAAAEADEAAVVVGSDQPPAAVVPPSPDSDADGVSDAFEASKGSDPRHPDTDRDGLMDGAEFFIGADARNVDTDADGLTDAEEVRAGTHATLADSDADGLADDLEIAAGRDPLRGLPPDQAAALASGPVADADADSLSDAYEAAIGTNAALADSDLDGLADDLELAGGTNPLDADSNDDGLLDSFAPVAEPVEGGAALTAPIAFTAPAPTAETPPSPPPPPAPPPPPPTSGPTAQAFIDVAVAETGDVYRFGAEAQADDANPEEFDCSELVEWTAAQVGLEGVPDTAYGQYSWLKEQGALISPEEAMRTPGALLFVGDGTGTGRDAITHVAISMGDGTTIEARGRRYGVGSWEAADRFSFAAVIPGFAPSGSEPPAVASPDSDADGVSDAFEASKGSDPRHPDTDRDGLMDGAEFFIGADARNVDTDADGLTDAEEVRAGTHVTPADSDADGLADDLEIAAGRDPLRGLPPDQAAALASGPVADADADSLSDAYEAAIGTNAALADSDLDGLADDLELAGGTNPLDADSNDDGLLDSFPGS